MSDLAYSHLEDVQQIIHHAEVAVSHNQGIPMYTLICYSPYYRDPRKDTANFVKPPHLIQGYIRLLGMCRDAYHFWGFGGVVCTVGPEALDPEP